MIFRAKKLEIKSRAQIIEMRAAGLIVHQALSQVRDAARPGLGLLELDALADRVIRAHGAQPSFLGYEGFPNSVCVSVNAEVIHGIPTARTLVAGDIVSVDCGAVKDGWHGDAAVTFIVGESSAPEDDQLVSATEAAMWAGIAAMATGSHIRDIGIAVEDEVVAQGDRHGWDYGIVEDFVGHGIGSQMHMDPDVPNFRVRERGAKLVPGLCLAIEPMITHGDPEVVVGQDGWTVTTVDGARAAHWEHTVAIMDDGICVLTAGDGGRAGLAPFGVVPVQL